MKLNFKNIDSTFWVIFLALIVVAVIALFLASSPTGFSHHSVLGPVGKQRC